MPNRIYPSLPIFVTPLFLLPVADAQAPSFSADTPVVHGATFQAGIVPGGWVTIRRSNFATVTRIWRGSDFNGNRLPESLEGLSVRINGRAAYVYFVSPAQLNVLAPDDTTQGRRHRGDQRGRNGARARDSSAGSARVVRL
jgi:hypothetical protein